jgi:hypothetical protein
MSTPPDNMATDAKYVDSSGRSPGVGGRQFTRADGTWSPIATHSEYWDPHNPSQENMAFIVTGQTDRVH